MPKEFGCVACRKGEVEVGWIYLSDGDEGRRIVNEIQGEDKMELTAHPAATVRPVLGLSH